MCQGNFCDDGKKGREAGNGQIVVMKKVQGDEVDGFDCYWKTVTNGEEMEIVCMKKSLAM